MQKLKPEPGHEELSGFRIHTKPEYVEEDPLYTVGCSFLGSKEGITYPMVCISTDLSNYHGRYTYNFRLMTMEEICESYPEQAVCLGDFDRRNRAEIMRSRAREFLEDCPDYECLRERLMCEADKVEFCIE